MSAAVRCVVLSVAAMCLGAAPGAGGSPGSQPAAAQPETVHDAMSTVARFGRLEGDPACAPPALTAAGLGENACIGVTSQRTTFRFGPQLFQGPTTPPLTVVQRLTRGGQRYEGRITGAVEGDAFVGTLTVRRCVSSAPDALCAAACEVKRPVWLVPDGKRCDPAHAAVGPVGGGRCG